VRFLLVRVGGTAVGCSAELIHKDTVYGWYGGSDRAFSRYIPNDLLVWHILEWGARNGYRVYDFGGAGAPDEDYGVRDFKAKFGGQLVNFGRSTHVHAPVRLRCSTVGYRFLRRFL
jgi:serine/alanine adding enzyme